jgi:hypothetical protein
LLLLSSAGLADYYPDRHGVRAGHATRGIDGRAVSRSAPAPLPSAARAVGHAETVSVALAEKVNQTALVVTEQQLRDASHVRNLPLALKSRYNANDRRRYPMVPGDPREIARRGGQAGPAPVRLPVR